MTIIGYTVSIAATVALCWLLALLMRRTIERIPAWLRDPIRRGQKNLPRNWLVTGGTGPIGDRLIRTLIRRGDNVILLTDEVHCARNLYGPHVAAVADIDTIAHDTRIDVVADLRLAGITPQGRGNSPDTRLSDHADAEALVSLIQRLQRAPGLLIAGSSVEIYENAVAEDITENSALGDTPLARLLKQREAVFRKAEKSGVRVVRLRTGLVVRPKERAFTLLRRTRPSTGDRSFAGAETWLNWISMDDLIGLFLHAEDRTRMNGAVNAVAAAVPYGNLLQELAPESRSLVLQRVLAFLAAFLPGRAPGLLRKAPVRPIQATKTGYRFQQTRLGAAIKCEDKPAWPVADEAIAFFNMDCPVCGTEARMCQRRIDRSPDHVAMTLTQMSDRPDLLAAYGLEPAHLSRRLYLMEADGRMFAGIDALIRIWEKIPAYRWRARILRLPGLHLTADFLYETLVAPFVDSQFGINSARARTRAGRLRGSEGA